LPLQLSARPPTPADRVQGLWGDVGTVRPDNRAAVDEVPCKELGDFERLNHRPLKPLGKVDRVLGSIVEDHTQAEATSVLGLDDARKKFHGFFSGSGAMLSSGCPAFIFAQFASSSARCS